MRITDYVNALPDAYKKHSESNNYKLLMMEHRSIGALADDIEAVESTLNIYDAIGKTLDLYGQMYSVPRGDATDEQYRYLITQKVAQNMVTGDYNSIVNAISVAFNVPVTSFSFRELGQCEVEALNLPYGILIDADITVKQMRDIIQGLLPVGVTLKSLDLDGTFEFSDMEYEASTIKGFCQNEGDEEGGYFGILSDYSTESSY